MITCNGSKVCWFRKPELETEISLKQMHPAEIEGVIESISGVASACALNVAENVVAVLVIKLPDSNITEESLTAEGKAM